MQRLAMLQTSNVRMCRPMCLHHAIRGQAVAWRRQLVAPRNQHHCSTVTQAAATFADLKIKSIDNKPVELARYNGNVLLIVNIASQCGFRTQMKELVELFHKYDDSGFKVLAFPCNQFGNQEPGSPQQIKEYAASQGFPTEHLFAKVDVNGPNTDPLYKYLKERQGGLLGSNIKWNFSKFLVDKNGEVVKRYGSITRPKDIVKDIEALLV